MSLDKMAEMDFDRARRKAFWRKLFTWLTGETNELLPFDDIREKLPIKGQYYAGLQQVPIDQIVGSYGRYQDFDRIFLPLQTHTRGRWLSIDKAIYEEVILPPVDLYKMGEIYFVKDGNHRVSVARERGQEFIDAFVTEIVVPFDIAPDASMSEITLQKERTRFLEKTEIDQIRPDNHIQTNQEGQYAKLLEHIKVHRWYLGEQKNQDIAYREAVISWYDTVYLPLVEELRDQDLPELFPNLTETDIYLWIIKYLYFIGQILKDETVDELLNNRERKASAKDEAARQVMQENSLRQFGKLASVLQNADWVDDLILSQERAAFLQQTRLSDIFPDARLETSIPGQYEKLLEHIAAHCWYLGEQQNREIPFDEAVKSWYQGVYLPLVTIIRELNIMDDFPARKEADLYLWIISHQWYLRETLGTELPVEQVAEQLVEAYSDKPPDKGKTGSKDAKKKEQG